MFARTILRSQGNKIQRAQPLISQSQTKSFHPSSAIMVKVGDAIPSVDLYENSPANKVNLANELKSGKGVIVGIPGAFSPGCSQTHIPGFIAHPKTKENKVYVVAVNDTFALKGWVDTLEGANDSGIRFLADMGGEFTGAFDMLFDSEAYFGNKRSRRYTILTEDGKVIRVEVEEDPSKITNASAENNL